LAVRALVVLKEPGAVLRDGDRELPSRGECLFRIARLGAGIADIVGQDGGVRGWVKVDDILPLESAAEHFSRLIAAAPGDAQSYLSRGRVWIEKEQWDRALADIDAAIRLKPSMARSHHLRGLVLNRQKKHVEAIASFSEAIRLDPAFAPAYRDRGLAWDARRFFDEAIADLNEAVRLDPGNVAFVLSRGKVCSSRGRHHQAMADFEWLIRVNPGDPTGYVARGEELMEDLEADRAIADFTKALELDPTFISALVLRAKAWKRRFEYTRAIADLAEACRRGPDHSEPHRALAWLLATCIERALRDGPRAVQEGTTACELSHWNSPECLDALSAACAEVGDFSAATKWQARAVELLPKDAPSRPLLRRRLFIYEAKQPYRD
jgi:tetratricopeptide (TPR) repeat protein